MAETTFENAKKGDRVWDWVYGWGTISHTTGNLDDSRRFSVEFHVKEWGDVWFFYRNDGSRGFENGMASARTLL